MKIKIEPPAKVQYVEELERGTLFKFTTVSTSHLALRTLEGWIYLKATNHEKDWEFRECRNMGMPVQSLGKLKVED